MFRGGGCGCPVRRRGCWCPAPPATAGPRRTLLATPRRGFSLLLPAPRTGETMPTA
eukprot:jgi/Mesen1/940/ME000118S00126